MIDIPASINGYHADQSRTYFAGQADPGLKELYYRLKEIQDFLAETIRPGMTCQSIYQMAITKAEDLNVAEPFLNFGNGKRCKIVGHGVGLEVNEPPVLSSSNDSTVEENHVITLELHMMKEDLGVVKLEDTLLIQNNGNRFLTLSTRELLEL